MSTESKRIKPAKEYLHLVSRGWNALVEKLYLLSPVSLRAKRSNPQATRRLLRRQKPPPRNDRVSSYEKLGYADATRFVMLLDKGSGDSLKYFRDLWKETSAEEIYRKTMARRERVQNE